MAIFNRAFEPAPLSSEVFIVDEEFDELSDSLESFLVGMASLPQNDNFTYLEGVTYE